MSAPRIALLLAGSVAYVELAIALLRRGIFPIPMDPALSATERTALLDYLRPTSVITDQTQLEALLAEQPRLTGPPLGRPIHLTSGTTGSPKGVYSGLLSPENAQALLDEERDLWGFRGDDVNLVLSPLHHSAPLRFAMGTVLAGGSVTVPEPPFSPERVTAAIVQHRPTTMFCVPAHLQRLFEYWNRVGVPELGSFRLVAHAGAPCPEPIKRRLIELFPANSVWEFYGSTEGQFTACPSATWLQHRGTLGSARPGRIMRSDERGQLWCVCPEHARFSYLHDPAKTAAAWRDFPEGRAFTVGDLGRVDDNGLVYLDGRREDLIITGGVNVYPAEVEKVLGGLDGVDDIAIYGQADDRWGQRVCAAVVGSASEAELTSYARHHLSPAKRPKQWRFLEALPRTATGKVRRLDLAD